MEDDEKLGMILNGNIALCLICLEKNKEALTHITIAIQSCQKLQLKEFEEKFAYRKALALLKDPENIKEAIECLKEEYQDPKIKELR